MNYNNYGLIIFIFAFVLLVPIDARGGRTSGGRRSSSSSGSGGGRRSGGGFWRSLFGGGSKSSDSVSKSSSPTWSAPKWQPQTHSRLHFYPHYMHTSNSGGYVHRSSPSQTADSSESIYNKYSDPLFSVNYNNPGFSFWHPGSSFIPAKSELDTSSSDQPEPTTTVSPKDSSHSDITNFFNELDKPIDSSESLDAFLDRMSRIDFSRLFNSIAESVKTTSTNSQTEEPSSSSADLINFSTEATEIETTSTSIVEQQLPAEDKHADEDLHNATPPEDILVTTTTTSNDGGATSVTQPTVPDVSTPYGTICVPIKYNEVNEFGVEVTIEKLACYPSPAPLVPEE